MAGVLGRNEVLIHQPTVDFIDSSGGLYQTALKGSRDCWPPVEEGNNTELLQALHLALDLKRAEGTPHDKVFDITSCVTTGIKEKRRQALLLADDLCRALRATGLETSQYALADVKDFTNNAMSPDALHISNVVGSAETTFVRLEEALTPRAEQLINDIKARQRSFDDPIYTDGDELVMRKESGNHKRLPMHGYVFNRNDEDPANRVAIPALPCCEAMMATTVLEQVSLAPNVIRVVPYWMRDREETARDMLKLLGYSNLPVLSVIVGSSGDVDKILPWNKPLPDTLSHAKAMLSERMAHTASTRAAKQIHDTIFKEHRAQFERYCRPHIKDNIPPSTVLKIPLLTQRAHEFMSRTLRAAPLYEAMRISSQGLSDVISDIRTLRELFNQNYQGKVMDPGKKRASIQTLPGKNTNDVAYLHTVLASRPEEDPVCMPDSARIDLVAHMVFEHASKGVSALAQSAPEELMTRLSDLPPRYILLEGRRTGPTLPKVAPVRL